MATTWKALKTILEEKGLRDDDVLDEIDLSPGLWLEKYIPLMVEVVRSFEGVTITDQAGSHRRRD